MPRARSARLVPALPALLVLGLTLPGRGADPAKKADTAAKPLLSWKAHDFAVTALSFSSDGKRLATASTDRTVKLWDPVTGKELLTFKEHTAPVLSVVIAADGKRVLSAGGDKTVR